MNGLMDNNILYRIKIIELELDNNNYDNLYGAVTWPFRYKGASQATK